MKTVAMKDFGKDHWSVLAYVETLCVDGDGGVGQVDYKRLRVNEKTHPLLAKNFSMTKRRWKGDWGTRLRGFWPDATGRTDLKRQIRAHDDVNCMEDLEDAGLIVYSTASGVVTLTNLGRRISSMIREHKTKGGHFATFEFDMVNA